MNDSQQLSNVNSSASVQRYRTGHYCWSSGRIFWFAACWPEETRTIAGWQLADSEILTRHKWSACRNRQAAPECLSGWRPPRDHGATAASSRPSPPCARGTAQRGSQRAMAPLDAGQVLLRSAVTELADSLLHSGSSSPRMRVRCSKT